MPNTAYQRGFPATRFPDFGLCRRSRILVVIFGALSLHPKIPFPATGLSAKSDRTNTGNSAFLGRRNPDLGPALQLFRIEPERLKLTAPFSRRIAEPLDA